MDKKQNNHKPCQGYQFASKLFNPRVPLFKRIGVFFLNFIVCSILCHIGDTMSVLDSARFYFLGPAVMLFPLLSVKYLLLKSPLGKRYQYAARQKKVIIELFLFCLLLMVSTLLLSLSGFLSNVGFIILLCVFPSIVLLGEMIAQSN